MKYCIKYYGGSSVLREADELKIKWHLDDTAEGLDKFISDYIPATKRLIIDISEITDNNKMIEQLSIFDELKGKCNFTIMLSFEYQKDILIGLQTLQIPFFFCEHINNWDKLINAASQKVTDVYITDNLGFDMRKVANYCHTHDIQIRVYPNTAQSTDEGKKPITSFFIRPEDEYIYANLIDIYEFWGPLNKQPVLMKIYKDHKWLGNLNEIILNLDVSVESSSIVPCFADARSKCMHRCDLNKCDVCNAVISLGKAITENNKWIRIDYPKENTTIEK